MYDFLVHRVFNPVSRYCHFHVLLAAGSLVPTNLSTTSQAATPPSSSATRSERSCPKEKLLFLPSPYASLGTEQRASPSPKKEPVLLQGAER